MNKDKAQQHIEDQLPADDSLIGFFLALKPFNWWLFLLIGPFAVLTMKYYFVAVTRNGITFHRLGMMGGFSGQDAFPYKDIESVKIGKGILQRPMTFRFQNGRKLHLKAQLKGVEKVAKITEATQRHIENNVRTTK